MTQLPELSTNSFHEHLYVTPDLAPNSPYQHFAAGLDATAPDQSLERWIREVAAPSTAIARFVTFRQIFGVVKRGDQELLTKTEPFDISGYTYLDGIICAPTVDGAFTAIQKQRTDTERTLSEGQVQLVVMPLLQDKPDQLVVDRFGYVRIFDTARDRLLPLRA